MRKLTPMLSLALSTAALTLSGTAVAQTAPAERPARAAKPDMTRAQAQERAEARFARMDANQDGTFDTADRAARKAAMFDRLDSDRSGSISQAELEARHAERGGKRKDRRPGREGAAPMTDAQKAERRAAMFARVDADGNGSLSRAELEAMHAKRAARGGGMKGHRMGGMMAAMDQPMTRQAFVDHSLAMFDRADSNRDGTVTGAERKAVREGLRERYKARKAAGQQS